MNKTTVIIGILFLISLGVTVAGYFMTRKQPPASLPAVVVTEEGQPTSGFPVTQEKASTPSPFPTVAQIPLTVSSPSSGSTVATSVISVKGRSSPKAEVFINDKETVADSQGNFSVSLTLDEGVNEIIIVANNADGSYSELVITVTYDPAV